MGLRTTLQNAARTAVTAIGDLAITVDYKSFQESELDPTTGVSNTWYVYEAVSCVLVDYTQREVDGENILPRDQKLLIPGVNITFAPKARDQMEIPSDSGEDLEIWEVIGADLDTAGALWVLQIRRVQ